MKSHHLPFLRTCTRLFGLVGVCVADQSCNTIDIYRCCYVHSTTSCLFIPTSCEKFCAAQTAQSYWYPVGVVYALVQPYDCHGFMPPLSRSSPLHIFDPCMFINVYDSFNHQTRLERLGRCREGWGQLSFLDRQGHTTANVGMNHLHSTLQGFGVCEEYHFM